MARAFRAVLALVTAAAAAAHAGRAGYDVAVTPTHVFIVGYTKFETSAPATIAFEGGQLNNLKIKTKTKSSSDDEDREEGRRDTTAAPSTNTAPANVAGAGARAPEAAAQVNTYASALSEAREASSPDNSSSYKVPSGADELLAIKELIYQHNFLTNVTVGTKVVSRDVDSGGRGRGVAVISGTEIQKGGTCITPVARTTPRAGKPGSGVVSNRFTAGAGGAASATVSACAVVYSPAWG